MIRKIFILGWVLISISLFLYSFTQVDLSLTLSRMSIYQTTEKWFQYVGYFNRPFSTNLFIGIIILMFASYIFVLRNVLKKKLDMRTVWWGVILVTIILAFSYNAFSYDLFNYIFDAKILVHYHLNPYQHKALDFLGDPMLSFMHWTQRTYPYGPTWLIITAPLVFIGNNIFLVTFFLFKILAAASFLGTTWFVKKIAEKTKIIKPEFAVASFAFNPLVIIESLVSGHNDIVMMFFAIMALFYFIENKYIVSILSFLMSILLKFATGILLPVLLWFSWKGKKTEKSYEQFFLISSAAMIIPVIFATLRTNFQPWYLLDVLPIASLVFYKKYVALPVIIFSFISLCQYIPFLFTGNWNPPIPTILVDMNWVAFILSCIAVVIVLLQKKKSF